MSLGRVVLVARTKGDALAIEPADVIRVHDDDMLDLRSKNDLQELNGFRFEHVGHEDDLQFLHAGCWCWPPRAT